MCKKPLLLIAILWLTICGKLSAQDIADKAGLIKEVFAFFKLHPTLSPEGYEATIRSMEKPDWYEYLANEKITGFTKARRRYRRTGCYKLNELVLSLDTITDKQITRLWSEKDIINPAVTRLDDIHFGLYDFIIADSLNYEYKYEVNTSRTKAFYNEDAYRKYLYIPDVDIMIYIIDKKSRSKLLMRVMLHALPKDRYELQLVFANFIEDC